MSFPTWRELFESYCSNRTITTNGKTQENPLFEHVALRRYNPSPINDVDACRLTFLKSAVVNPTNKTLSRKGRFLWCKNLHYEGRSEEGYRQVSFTVDRGNKRFITSERDMLCVPSKVFIHNNKYFRSKIKTFTAFSTVFSYGKTINSMVRSSGMSEEKFKQMIAQDNPFKPGCLVAPRLGYFHPDVDWSKSLNKKPGEFVNEVHPCGIILGNYLVDNSYAGRELYRVRFGDITYEKVHPVQMEILNEV
tara:strand:- start:3611 stop:4357 length:747 start_codon:yes stop_codon:yes gene_type:complete